MTTDVALGVDLGGTKARAVVLCGGEPHWSATRPTGAGFGPADSLRLLDELATRAAAEVGTRPTAVGVGVPGLVDAAGRVRSSVILEGWDDVALADRMRERLGGTCVVDNDVNHAARAESWTRGGAAGVTPDLMFVSVGTGIGGALVLGGRVWTGSTGLAGEIGHVRGGDPCRRCDCGRDGCISASAGGRATERHLGVAPGGLEAVLAAGDPDATAAVLAGAEALGEVLADAMHLLDLGLVVLGGGVPRHPGYLDAARAGFHRRALPEVAGSCSVEAAASGYDAGAIGAALAALAPPAPAPAVGGTRGGEVATGG